jgi:uncharacterized protein
VAPSRSRSRSRTRYRILIALLVLVTAGLAAVLVSCPKERQAETPAPTPAPQPEPAAAEPVPKPPEAAVPGPSAEPVRPPPQGLLAIVIDDAGYDLSELQPFLELPMPLAVAVLPNLPHSGEAARRVLAAGKELLLHLPMEPEGGENPGPGALLTGQPAAELERLLDEALRSVPGAVGVNNHMGSRATADRTLMGVVLGVLARRRLFFLDSRTTTLTVAASEADRLGVPYLARKVFLDAVDGGIEQGLAAAVAAAARGGSAVAIGHVQSGELAAILRRAAGDMERAGVRPAALETLIAGRGGRTAE